MATTGDDETTKRDNFAEKTCREITASEKKRQQIRERGGIQSRRQKLALLMGGAQLASFAALCVPLWVYGTITYCSVPQAMIVLYSIAGIAVIGHIVLIFTAIRKVQPGGLWIPMAVQLAVVAISAVQLFLMLSLYSKASTVDFNKETCRLEGSTSHEQGYRQRLCTTGAGMCLLTFALGIAGIITNILLFFELGKAREEEDCHQNRQIVERQQTRIARLHAVIRLHENRADVAANEAIKTAKEPAEQAAEQPRRLLMMLINQRARQRRAGIA